MPHGCKRDEENYHKGDKSEYILERATDGSNLSRLQSVALDCSIDQAETENNVIPK